MELDHEKSCCLLCTQTEDEIELIDIESNSLECGDEIYEFGDLIYEVLQVKLDSGLLCVECQNQLTQFFFFKTTALSNLSSQDNDQRSTIIKKLDMFLEDCESKDLVVLRYNQCFTVVPEGKRSLMDNFQSWQPRAILDRIDEKNKIDDQEFVVCAEEGKDEAGGDSNFGDELIVEDDQEYSMETEDIKHETDMPSMEHETIADSKHPKQLREWANETTKRCYSMEQSEDGIVPVWTCCHCDKTYYSAQALRLHLLAKHADEDTKPTKLPEEIKNWLKSEGRQQRSLIETHDGNKFEWTCSICNYTCTSSTSFRAHLVESHVNKSKPAAARNSEKTLNYHQQQWIQSHIKQETEDKNWKCLKCDIAYESEKLLRQHLLEHALSLTPEDFKSIRPDAVRPRKAKLAKFQWTCQECWFQFSAQRSYDSHMKLHTTLDGMTPFTSLHNCSDCKMFFRSPEDLTSHLNGHSNNESLLVPAEGIALQKMILFKRLLVPQEAQSGEFLCGHCGRRIDGETNCKSHLLIHHINPLVCPRDGRKFLSMQPFICHLKKVHPEILPGSLCCTHCGLPFDNIYERLAHMRLCDEKKFHCDHCDKKFSNKNYLNSHLKREMGLLSCSCTICGKVLKAKDELKIHMRSHTKEKPFKCSVCDKTYTTTSARASHMETHKDTVIQCELCTVKFVARRHYVIHYKRFHDEAYRHQKLSEQTCHLCAKQFIRKDRLRDHMQKAHAADMA